MHMHTSLFCLFFDSVLHCVCMYMCVHVYVPVTIHVQRPEDNLQDSVLSFYCVDSGYRTKVFKPRGKCPLLLLLFQSLMTRCTLCKGLQKNCFDMRWHSSLIHGLPPLSSKFAKISILE